MRSQHNMTKKLGRDELRQEESILLSSNKTGEGLVLVCIWQQIIQGTLLVSFFSPSEADCELMRRRCRFEDSGGL